MVFFKNKLISGIVLVVFLFLQFIFLSLNVLSFNVQRDVLVGTGSLSTTISQVNTSNAFILFTAGVGDATPDDWQFTPNFLNSTQIDFTRYDGAAASANVSWQVIEDENLNVQRGSSVWAVSNNSEDITINSVNLTESFVIVYGRCADEANTDNLAGFFSGNFTDSTTLHLERGNAASCAATVSWQVVEWNGALVQSGTDSILDNENSVSPSINSVDMKKSFLIFSTASIGTDQGMDSNLILGNITSPTQLFFTHEPGTVYADSKRIITWYVIEHPYFFTQTGQIAVSVDTTDTIPNPVNVSRSFHFSSGWNTGGGQTYSNSLHDINMSDSTTLIFDKTTTAQTQTIFWQVIEINRPPVVTLLNPENNFKTANHIIDFNFTVSDLDYDVQNCSLYSNYTGIWDINKTIYNPQDNTELNFTVNSSEGNYIWNIVCLDSKNNFATAISNRTLTTDYSPPIISNLENTSITNESVLIKWNLNELGNASINYGTTLDLSLQYFSLNNATFHSLNIQNLQANTTYYYNVTSCDLLGNCITIGPYDFNTTDTADTIYPKLINITNYSIADYSAKIHWITDEDTNASVNYGTSLLLANTKIEDFLYDVSHDVTLTNLEVNTLYYYNVTSCDPSGNCNSSQTFNFTTIDTLAPNVTLSWPEISSNLDEQEYIDFNFTVNDSQTTVNCSLYGDFNGSWDIYYNVNNPVNNQKYNFNYLLNKTGVFEWNVYCIDNSSNSGWAEDINRTFSVYFSPPYFTTYTINNSNPYRYEDVMINVTIVDVDLQNYTFSINHSGSWINYSTESAVGPSVLVSVNVSLLGVTNEEICYQWFAGDVRGANNKSKINCFNIKNVLPTQSNPLLESSHLANTTTENLICYNQSTYDYDNHPVKNLYNWTLNSAPLYVTYAPFEGGTSDFTSTIDYSGVLGYDFIVAGATFDSSAGYDGKGAYIFDGNDYIDLDSGGASAIYDATVTERTFILWYKADAISGTTYRMLFGEGGGTNGLEIYIYDSKIYGGAWSEGSSWNGDWRTLPTTANDWHFVAFVFDGSQNRTSLFHDGQWNSTTSVGGNQVNGHTGDDGLGWADGAIQSHLDPATSIPSGSYFTGILDEFMVFNKALTYEQLNLIYQNDFSILSFNETSVGDQWQCSITPNDGYDDGLSLSSNSITILDNIVPVAYNLSYTPLDPVLYSANLETQFNITWDDFDGIKNSYIEHNFNGVLQNYSMDGNLSSIFYYNYSSILPGNRTFRFFANDTFNAENVSSQYFYIVVNGTINSTSNITIIEDVDIDWTPIDFAESYNIYYTDDLTQSFQLLESDIIDTNWTDPNADLVNERYYQISANILGTEINTTKIIGKQDYSSVNNWSLVSIPFNLSEWTLKNNTFDGLQIHTEPDNCIVSIYRYNTSGDCFSQTDAIGDEWYPAIGCDNFDTNSLEFGRGYWFLFNQSCIVSFVGEVPDTTVDYSLSTDYNVVGWYSTNNATLPTYGEPSYYPIDVTPTDAVWLIIRYNEEKEYFEHTGHYAGWGWWPYKNPDGVYADFVSLEPMRSYYFVASENTIWSYNTK